MGAVIAGLSMVGLLLVVGAAFYWQERHRFPEKAVIYGVEESISYIWERLGEPARNELALTDVRRILEWGVRYLQDPAVRRDGDVPAVAGGIESAAFVQEQALAQGHAYDGPLILEVLDLQGEYLASIGAVGDPVVEDETPEGST